MGKGVSILGWQCEHYLNVCFVIWFSLLGMSVHAEESKQTVSLCQPDEGVGFSCSVGSKIVSICYQPKLAAISMITYKYGKPGNVEYNYSATLENKRYFSAYAMPVNPRAMVEQVWFDNGNTRYLLTACTGGSCNVPAGLLVYQGDRVLVHKACNNQDNEQPWFSRKLLKFGSNVEQSNSLTDLIKIEEEVNDLDSLYH